MRIAFVALALVLVAPSLHATGAPHGPILVVGDADLLAQAAAEGWPGTGTAEDPVVIQGYDIAATRRDGIALLDLTLAVLVQDVRVRVSDPRPLLSVGVYVENATRVRLERVDAAGGFAGVYARSAPGVEILDVQAHGNEIGVFVARSPGARVAGGSATDNALSVSPARSAGVALSRSDDAVVEGLDASRSGRSGLVVLESDRVTLRDVVSDGSRFYGLEASGSDDLRVEGASFTDASWGAWLYLSRRGTFEDVTVSDQRESAFFIDTFSDNATLRDVHASDSAAGVWVQSSSDPRLEGGLFERNGCGVVFHSAARPTASGARVVDGGCGIRLESSFDARLEGNVLRGNDVGVDTACGFRNTFLGNDLANDVNARARGEVLDMWAGNRWSDYVGADADGDGVGDVPYGPITGAPPAFCPFPLAPRPGVSVAYDPRPLMPSVAGGAG